MAEVDMKEKWPSNKNNKYSSVPRKTSQAEKEKNAPKKRKAAVKERQPTFGDRIVDNVKNIDHQKIRSRLIYDWLLPEVVEVVDDLLRRIFFGNDAAGRRRQRGNGGYTAYSSISDGSKNREPEKREEPRDPTRQNFRRIRLEFYDKTDAEDVIDELRETLENNNETSFVTVKELYSACDLPTNPTMYKWGWFDLEDATIEHDTSNDLWVLVMPRAEVIR